MPQQLKNQSINQSINSIQIKSNSCSLRRAQIRLAHEIRLDGPDNDDLNSRSDEIELSETANPNRKRVSFERHEYNQVGFCEVIVK